MTCTAAAPSRQKDAVKDSKLAVYMCLLDAVAVLEDVTIDKDEITIAKNKNFENCNKPLLAHNTLSQMVQFRYDDAKHQRYRNCLPGKHSSLLQS